MGQFIGSSSVEVFGEEIDINDDARLRAVLREQARKALAPMAPIMAKNVLLDLVTDLRIITTKYAFVLNQTLLQGTAGIGISTCSQFYDQLVGLSGLGVAQSERPLIAGPDGNPISAQIADRQVDLEEAIANASAQDPNIPPEPPAPTDEL